MNLPSIQPASWRLTSGIPHHIIPNELRNFLLDPGSTTRRMQREYASQIKVKLLKQAWCYPYYQEAQHLQIPLRQYAFIRETYLSCQGKTWMYAKAIFPQYFFIGKNQRLLKELDQRPLGKLLFRDPSMRRSEFEIALLQPHHLEYQWATQKTLNSLTTTQPTQLWARRSIIQLQAKPLLLTEIFFPEFFQLVKTKP